DGGGVRGLSELLILRELLHRLGYERGGKEVRPCEEFDMIGGTGTGGWIAIMLGRLGMTTEEAISAYSDVVTHVFSNGKKWSKEGMYKATALENAFKHVLKSRLGASNLRMRDETTDSLRCRTFVCAQLEQNFTGGRPTLFRSYRPHTASVNPLIWEAARATSANPFLFKRIAITDGGITEVYIDGGTGGANNPIQTLLAEARVVFPGRSVGCIISLGAGHPNTISIPTTQFLKLSIRHRLKVAKTARAIAEDCEAEAEKVAIQLKGYSNIYFRLSVDQGMQGIKQADVEKLNAVIAHTSQYMKMETVMTALEEAVRALK
ncbi:FabD lysophospholipase-like protein, partial [Coniophora puteana RWD-64-598 SS2]